jgi:uncharacterized protein (TIGR00661 family)
MKILYGVQGTGNGHITRARTMASALKKHDADIDWVFSGRPREDYFDMEVFGDFRVFRGLTFVIDGGRVCYSRTVFKNNVWQLYRDSRSLNVEDYDLVINDFEPVSAWAAKRAGKRSIGISHQNAFLHKIPKQGNNPGVGWFMRNFAPTQTSIGLHWYHYNQPILPPLIEPLSLPNKVNRGHYLVYLPFYKVRELTALFGRFPDCVFDVYQPVDRPTQIGNVYVWPFSRQGFQRHLHTCEGVICNAGFELTSEAIQLGKKVLVQPVKGQMEQLSNALALRQLGYGTVTQEFDSAIVAAWLASAKPKPIDFPNVADALAEWIVAGCDDLEALQAELWRTVPEPELRWTLSRQFG